MQWFASLLHHPWKYWSIFAHRHWYYYLCWMLSHRTSPIVLLQMFHCRGGAKNIPWSENILTHARTYLLLFGITCNWFINQFVFWRNYNILKMSNHENYNAANKGSNTISFIENGEYDICWLLRALLHKIFVYSYRGPWRWISTVTYSKLVTDTRP